MQIKTKARSKKHKEHIDAIMRYETAVGGWIVLMSFLGLSDKCTIDEFAIRMAQLQKESEQAKKSLAILLKADIPTETKSTSNEQTDI